MIFVTFLPGTGERVTSVQPYLNFFVQGYACLIIYFNDITSGA